MFQVEQLDVHGFDGNFSYLATAPGGEAAIVDPCGDSEILRRAVEAHGKGIRPEWILITHRHSDHISALEEVKAFFPAKVCAAENSSLAADRYVSDGEKLPFGEGWIEAILTPGHTRDSICWNLSDGSGLFTGDTLFIDYIGFCRANEMFTSLRKLKALPDSIPVYPGHNYGHVPSEPLGCQKRTNPYFRPDTFEDFRKALLDLK